MAESNLNFIL